MLFSEPKIPQSKGDKKWQSKFGSFSALQRAENSSILSKGNARTVFFGFSALQRAENSSILVIVDEAAFVKSFSALQRAENSSIENDYEVVTYENAGFSALQRAENSSIQKPRQRRRGSWEVSVLFSEPKIPQSRRRPEAPSGNGWFQCSSASRKFLNRRGK